MGIPLVALNTAPQPDVGANIQRLLALKSMMQGQQLQQQQLQEGQQNIALTQQKVQDQKQVMDYMSKNPNDTFGDAATNLKGKISLGTYSTLMDTDAAIRQKHAQATQAELDNSQKVHDQQQKIYNNVAGLSDDDLAKQWPTISQQLNSIPGVDSGSKVDPNKPFTQQQMQQLGMAHGLQEAYLKQEADKRKEVAETTEATNKGDEAAAGASAKNAESLWYQQHPGTGAAGVPAEAVSQADWLAKNPGKTPSDYTIAMKKIVPAFNFQLQNNSGGVGQPAAAVAKQFGMSPEAFDQTAEKYYQSGTLPALGRGAAGPALQKAIMNRTAELHPGASLAEGSAEYKANSDSLKQVQSNADKVDAFEKTAGKNLDVFLNQAQKALDTGLPILNTPARNAARLLGGTDQTAFETSRQTAVNEISRVLNSANATGVVSDSARHEVEGLIAPNATVGQIMQASKILKQDMANRHQSYQDQISDIQNRIGGKGTSGGGQQTATPKSSGGHVIKVGNKKYQYNGSGDTADLKNYTEQP